MIKALLVGVISMTAVGTAPAQPRVQVTGLFSNMHYVRETGDVVGLEVLLVVGTGGGYVAVAQMAEGTPLTPTVVPVVVSGTDVAFELPLDRTLKFSGRVTRPALVGTLDGKSVTLRRGKSYWQCEQPER